MKQNKAIWLVLVCFTALIGFATAYFIAVDSHIRALQRELQTPIQIDIYLEDKSLGHFETTRNWSKQYAKWLSQAQNPNE